MFSRQDSNIDLGEPNRNNDTDDINEESIEKNESNKTNITTDTNEQNTWLDWLIRGKGEGRNYTKDKNSVRFDNNSKRWYLKLSTLDMKEIKVKVWQYSIDQD